MGGGGEETDWVGKKLTSQIFPREKKLTGRRILSLGKKLTGEKTDRYTSAQGKLRLSGKPVLRESLDYVVNLCSGQA